MNSLFENPIILVFLIWLISSLFTKAKGKNQNQTNPNHKTRPTEARTVQRQQAQPMHTERQKPLSPVKRLEQMAQEMAERLERDYSDKRKLAESTIRYPKESPAPVEIQAEPMKIAEVQPIMPHSEEKQLQSSKLPFSVEKQKVIDGVVWAEILGPPRSLNPHRTMRRK